jgi:hypothetical protein
MLRRPALQEQHLVAGGNAHQLAQVGFGLLDDAGELLAAMAHFHDAATGAVPVEQLFLRLTQDLFRQRAGPALKFQIRLIRLPGGLASRIISDPVTFPVTSATTPASHRCHFGFNLAHDLDNLFQTGQLFAVVERNQRDALRRPAHAANLGNPGADQHATGGDQHDFVFVIDQLGADHLAVALAVGNGDDALRAAAGMAEIGQRGAFAVSRSRSPPARSADRSRRPAAKSPAALSASFMPRTPRAPRPIGRTSSSSNQTALPASENQHTSLLPLVISTPIR